MSDKVATGTAYASSFVTIFASAWSFNELMMLSGFLVGLATFLYNVWFKERTIRDDRAYKQALLVEIRNKSIVAVSQDINDIIKDD